MTFCPSTFSPFRLFTFLTFYLSTFSVVDFLPVGFTSVDFLSVYHLPFDFLPWNRGGTPSSVCGLSAYVHAVCSRARPQCVGRFLATVARYISYYMYVTKHGGQFQRVRCEGGMRQLFVSAKILA